MLTGVGVGDIGFSGANLRKLRKSKGLSQTDLAVELGVHQQEVSDWEVGTVIPETPNILKILDFFKARPDYIFNVSEDASLETANQPKEVFKDELATAVSEDDLDKLEKIAARLRKLKDE